MDRRQSDLLPCPFCGDDGDKGRQRVTQMVDGRPSFDRIICRACGAMCPEPNWNSRTPDAALIAENARLREALSTLVARDERHRKHQMHGYAVGSAVDREWKNARAALSDNPAQERNQCDGCAQGAALRGHLHIDKDGHAFMACERDKYATALPHDNPARSPE